MRQSDFIEEALKLRAFYFIAELFCSCRKRIVYKGVPSVVSPMGDRIGYIVDGRLVTNEQMKEVLKDE